MKKITVSIVQLSAGPDITCNLKRIDELLSSVADVDLIALPEVFAVRGDREDHRKNAEEIPGQICEHLARAATRRSCWILAGSIVEKSGRHFYNTSALLDREGRIAATYRKIHLFEAHLEDGKTIRESDTYQAGSEPVLANIEGWKCGMTVCYDLRFPELFRWYADRGAHLFFIPSNFTQRTGKDHWEVLVRARAIENQCFVIAPDQCGINSRTGIRSHGHSMTVDPWGNVLCQAEDQESVLTAKLDPDEMARTRTRIPVIRHRRL